MWINVRTTPLPRLPFVRDVLVNARVDSNNKIADPFSEGFFIRAVVLSPDTTQILNRAPSTVAGSIAHVLREGDNAYAQTDAPDFLSMLRRALAKHRQAPVTARASAPRW